MHAAEWFIMVSRGMFSPSCILTIIYLSVEKYEIEPDKHGHLNILDSPGHSQTNLVSAQST